MYNGHKKLHKWAIILQNPTSEHFKTWILVWHIQMALIYDFPQAKLNLLLTMTKLEVMGWIYPFSLSENKFMYNEDLNRSMIL